MEKLLKKTLANSSFDNVPLVRSKTMAAVKSQGNKSTELKFCNALVEAKITGWRNQKKMIGNPDIVFERYKIVVFLDGCFWHGCPKCGHLPKKNYLYWETKIRRNMERDQQKKISLQNLGYTVLRFWEHELEEDLSNCISITKDTIEENLLALAKDH